MGLVDHQYGLAMVCQGGDFRKIRPIAIHAVKTLNRDPYSTGSAGGTPPQDRVVDGLDVIMAGAGDLGTAAAQPIMDARMNPLVVDHEVPALWSGGEQGEVRCVTAAKI
jgi:hypothetical protein